MLRCVYSGCIDTMIGVGVSSERCEIINLAEQCPSLLSVPLVQLNSQCQH